MHTLHQFLYIYAYEKNDYDDEMVTGKISYLKNFHTVAKQNIPQFIETFKIENEKDVDNFFDLISEEIEYLIKQKNENNNND